ncbi:hypothetical protein ACN3YC_004499 [Salmonella enterica subsp. enterica serovar Cerro]|uniref:hypothetical protein n=1 Tax=Aeromonas dhakensis TaxID=196024 RepID=UPI00383893F2
MQHVKQTALAVLVGLALAGCDNAQSPAGAGADATEGSGTGRASTVTRSTDLASNKDRAVTSETPVLPLLVRAVRDLVPDPDNPNQYAQTVCALARGSLTAPQLRAALEKQGADLSALPKPVQTILDNSQDANLAACAAYGVILTSRPRNGWDVSPDSRQAHDFMAGELAAGLATAETLAPIAQELAQLPGKSEAEYLELAAKRFRELSPLWVSTYDRELDARRQFVKDMTGRHAAPFHFTTSDGADFAADGGGAAIAYQGIDWYGRGYLKGTVYRVEVTQANSITINRSKADTATRDTSTREEASANVKTQ